MLVTQRDHNVLPTGLVDTVGDHLQTRRHASRTLDFFRHQVKLHQTVAFVARALGFLADAFQQAVVFNAKGGQAGENFQRLDRHLIGTATGTRIVHADQAQPLPARAVKRHE